MYDLIIVGSGPAGLSAALTAQRLGLSHLVIERGVIANTVYNYPLGKPLFSTPDEVELEPGDLPTDRKPTREEVLAHYTRAIARHGLQVHTGEEVRRIAREAGGLVVETDAGTYRARAVLVAIGGFGRPRKLGVPGETPARVAYRFSEAHPFAMRNVLVVGGGNSAAEAAIFLAEAGARVTLSVRRAELDVPASDGKSRKIKPWVMEPLMRLAGKGRVDILPGSRVVEIRPRSVVLEVAGRGRREIACDQVFALIGADPDTRLLEAAGVEIAEDGRPVYDPQTYETSVPGLYVAGHLTREMHMKAAIPTAQRVVEQMAAAPAATADR